MEAEDTVVENPTSPENQPQIPEVERVTKDTVKVKNPKRQAAGRAGAAARKAKQERLFEELRAAKESVKQQQDAPVVPVVHDHIEGRKPVSETGSVAKWTPWIIGVAGLMGAYIFIYQHQPQKAPQRVVNDQAIAFKPLSSKPPSAQQLKVTDDPFYMA